MFKPNNVFVFYICLPRSPHPVTNFNFYLFLPVFHPA